MLILYIIPALTLVIPGLALLVMYKFTRLRLLPFLLGGVLLLITILAQPLIQITPLILRGINPLSPPREILWLIILYYSLVSGFFQEFLKLFIVRNKARDYAYWVGGGFGYGEAIYVAIGQVVALLMGKTFPLTFGLLAVYERLLSLIYHIYSAALLRHYSSRGKTLPIYIILSLVHSGMNYEAVYIKEIYGLNVFTIPVIYGLLSIIVALLATYYHWIAERGRG